jgi:hypothetical protein
MKSNKARKVLGFDNSNGYLYHTSFQLVRQKQRFCPFFRNAFIRIGVAIPIARTRAITYFFEACPRIKLIFSSVGTRGILFVL